MQIKAKLTKCKDNLKTKAISDKAREFANKAVTAALKDALDTEFQALGVGHIKTKLNARVEQGKMRHKLVLDFSVTKKLDEILSEGEQRAIAIGSFLAEMHLANHRGGIVFDDPVSSLDHYRRKDVARRLIEEAKLRQVIIFTHDTVFLGELRDVIEQQNVDHLIHHLDWVNGYPGHVNEGLPWEHKSSMDRIDKHENHKGC
jgi:wobble nucleotide-excising tRNase